MAAKRIFDLFLSIIGLFLTWWIILLLIVISRIDTGGSGIFKQRRVGQYGKLFTIYKIRSMHAVTGKISKTGKFIRKYKLDELPQFFNILNGSMSFVGPRPDIPGYYDLLQGEDRVILELKPGLVSRAAMKYFNEDEILAAQSNPEQYNDEVIFPDKIQMNKNYYYNRSLKEDIKILFSFINTTLL